MSVDRRTFLGSFSLAGTVLLTRWPPLSLALTAGAAAGEANLADDLLHHVDDVWGHWPRYAHPIPHSRAPGAPLAWEQLDPADRAWAAWT